jgi:hypothetical protein
VQFKWAGFPGGGSVVFDIPGEPIEGDFFEFDGTEFVAERVVYVPGNPSYDMRITLDPTATWR